MDLVTNLIDRTREVIEEREAQYGPPRAGLSAIALAWNGYLKSVGNKPLSGSDVCNMMTMLKCVRDGANPDMRNDEDIMGYTLIKYK